MARIIRTPRREREEREKARRGGEKGDKRGMGRLVKGIMVDRTRQRNEGCGGGVEESIQREGEDDGEKMEREEDK